MANKPKRIVIDTNIFISFLITKSFPKLDKLIESGRITLLFSEELLHEFMEVVKRPKLKKYFAANDVSSLLETIHFHGELINVKSKTSVCRDKKDNFLLNLCKDGKADFLITGDEDLLTLKKHNKTRIIRIAEFLER